MLDHSLQQLLIIWMIMMLSYLVILKTVVATIPMPIATFLESYDFSNKVFSIINDRDLLTKLSSNAYETYRNCRKKVELDAEISKFICLYSL